MSNGKPCNLESGTDTVTGYMDLTDFECELGANADGNKVYPSIKACRADRKKCIDGCGIVEVRVTAVRIVQAPQDRDYLTEGDGA